MQKNVISATQVQQYEVIICDEFFKRKGGGRRKWLKKGRLCKLGAQ